MVKIVFYFVNKLGYLPLPVQDTMAHPPYDPSLDRQKLSQLSAEFSSILRFFCDHQPLLKGSLRTISRRCGKVRCRCNRGQPHRTTVFVDRQGDRPILRKVSGPDYRRLLPLTREYRRIRSLRARLSRLNQEALEVCDRLTRFRLAEGHRLHDLPTRNSS
jgi:hypothetical protein